MILTFPLANGGELRVIRDLSELSDEIKAEEIEHISRCLRIGRDKKNVYLVAANDGQLLEMWRSEAQKQGPQTGPKRSRWRIKSFAERGLSSCCFSDAALEETKQGPQSDVTGPKGKPAN